MKKKLLAIILSTTVVFAFTGCSSLPFNYDMSEYVKVAKYTGLEYDASKIKVTDEDIQKAIQEDLNSTATTEEVTSGVVGNGDTVNIDYSGKMNGKVADGTVAENQELEIGSNSFIDGFESGLIGKKIGSTVVLNLKFPDDYGKADYAGKAIEFTVKINSAKQLVAPKLSVSWVKEHTEYDSIKEYKERVKEDLVKIAKRSIGAGLLTSLTSKSEIIKYPNKELSDLTNTAIKYYKNLAKQYGVDYNTFIAQQMGSGVDDFEAGLREQAKIEIAEELVAYYIAKKEGIEATEDDVEGYVEKMMKTQGLNEEQFKEQTGLSKKRYIRKYKKDIIVSVTVQNVEEFLVEKGKAK